MQRWKVILRYTVIFMLGLVLGIVGSRLVHKHRFTQAMKNHPSAQRQIMRYLTHQLQLTEPQQIEIGRIVKVQCKALSDIRERNRPDVQAIFQQAQDEMKTHLPPEQQKKLDLIMERIRKQGRMHGGPPPPP